MKKILVLILSILLLSACAATDPGVDQRIAKLERTVARLQMSGAGETGSSFRPFRNLHGGAAGDLDYIDGSTGGLAIGDVAFVSNYAVAGYGDSLMTYIYRDFGADVTESLPWVVKPATNPQDHYAWSLSSASVAPPWLATGSLDLDTAITTKGMAILRSGFIQLSATGTIKLPAASVVGYGTTVCVWIQDATELAIIDINASDIMNLSGVKLDAGDCIENTSPAVGDFICMIATTNSGDGSTDGWITLGYKGTWIDGGAS